MRDTLPAAVLPLARRDAVAIVGTLLQAQRRLVQAYFTEIAKNTPVPVTLYNIPQFANDIPNDTIARLAEFDRVIGVKDSSRDLPRFLNMMHAIRPKRPDFMFLSGCEEILVPALLMGADGGTVATSNVVPEVVMKMYHLSRRAMAGDAGSAQALDEARRIQYSLLGLIKVLIFGADFPEGVRQAMILRGFAMGAGRQPLSPTQQLDLTAVRRTLQCLMSEHGVTDVPAGGCDSPLVSLRSNDVDRIVRDVLTRLQSGT